MTIKNVLCEKFDEHQSQTIQSDFERLVGLAPKAASSSGAVKARWFGTAAADSRLPGYIQKMSSVINAVVAGSRKVTFVNRAGGVLKVVYHSLLNPELMPVGSAGDALDGSTFAYAFPINRTSEAGSINDLSTLSHVGSGMRIYLCDLYFTLNDNMRSGTMYHELTHKVLATEDHCYDPEPCRRLASHEPNKAIRNADNYQFFLLESNGISP